MLRWRIPLSLAAIAVLAGLCWLDAQADRPGSYLAPVAVLLAALAAGELARMFRAKDHHPSQTAVYAGALLPVVASCIPLAWESYPADCPIGRLGWLALGLVAGNLIVFVAEMRRYPSAEPATGNVALGAFAVLYVGGLLGMLVQLRLLQPHGLRALISMIVIVKASDIGQFTVGKLLGRNKLAPRLSPGKTWEGLAGGIGFALAASVATALWGYGAWKLKFGACAILLAVAGVAGDLAVSLLKRDAGVKDSSDWLPGLGGVLDLLDSLLFAGPVAYLCWVAQWLE